MKIKIPDKPIVIPDGKHTPPEYQRTAFNCPHCMAYAEHSWFRIKLCTELGTTVSSNLTYGISISKCHHCERASIWFSGKMVYPNFSTVPVPIEEMPESIKETYNEARSISDKSPKAACALLRLAISELVEILGEKRSNLNQSIGNLVKKGLPVQIQQALDIVRVVGNNAVHPGEISIDDNPEIANKLFTLINIICEKMIKEKQNIEILFDGLPDNQKKAIEKRDKRTADVVIQ